MKNTRYYPKVTGIIGKKVQVATPNKKRRSHRLHQYNQSWRHSSNYVIISATCHSFLISTAVFDRCHIDFRLSKPKKSYSVRFGEYDVWGTICFWFWLKTASSRMAVVLSLCTHSISNDHFSMRKQSAKWVPSL